jgi:uncharacterized sporulation protein YeaH/YhbH (DUF444 family)
MALIVDKRLLPKNQATNSRQKFIDRYKSVIKDRIRDIVKDGSIKDFNKGPKSIKIKKDDLDIPNFDFEQGTGNTDRVYIGNKKFHRGDTLPRPSQGQGRGNKGSNQGGGEDDFEFILTEKEFSDLFFEDLALPNLIKREFLGSSYEIKHAGFSRYGGPASLNIKKTMLNALGRRIALKRRAEFHEQKMRETFPSCYPEVETEEFKENMKRVEHSMMLSGKKVSLSKPKKQQYIEDIDLRYNFKDKVDVPTTRAVMFCLMDVSGSMSETMKDIAKRFYILLNLFLRRNYTIVDVVFVRHTEIAEEVDEQKFFYDRESGGTKISTGYDKINEIIGQRYNPEQWNIYTAQASDGDNYEEDNLIAQDVLTQKLLPNMQYFAYIDVRQTSQWYREEDSDFLILMKKLMTQHSNLQARAVADYADIFPVFRSLFKKEQGK